MTFKVNGSNVLQELLGKKVVQQEHTTSCSAAINIVSIFHSYEIRG